MQNYGVVITMKRYISLGLVLTMISVFVFSTMAMGTNDYTAPVAKPVSSDFDGIIDPGTPHNFNNADLQDPYGYGKGVPFLLSEQNERFYMHNYYGSSTVKIKDTLKSKSSNTGRVLDSFLKSSDGAANDAVKQLNFSKAVAFDPTGSGRKDHVAVVGVNPSKELTLFFYNTRDNVWSYGFSLGKMSWVSDKSWYYMMGEFISITAGDYDGDHKDTVVVYGAFDGGHGLYEISMNADRSAQKLNGTVNNDMLNPAYNSIVTLYPDFISTSDYEGVDRLVCVLGTGDINADGVDDLAAMSYAPGHRYYYDVNYVLPYISVTVGTKGISGIFRNSPLTGEYLHDDAKYYDSNENTFNSVRAASMTVANTDNKRGDEIVIAGQEVTYYYYTSDGTYSYYSESSNLATAKYSLVNGGITRNYFINQCVNENSTTTMDINGFTVWGLESVGRGTAQVAVQSVYMNGKGNYAYVLVGGDLYDYSDTVMPKKVYDFSYLNNADKGVGGSIINVNFISSVTTGNFDGNSEGFEQIVMALGRKETSFDDTSFSVVMIGIDYSKRDPVTMLPTDLNKAFYSTSAAAADTMDAWDEGDDFYEAPAFLLVAVDNDDDGVLAKYNSKDYAYSDPDVLAILQEAPFFSELDPYIADRSATTYAISETKTLTQGSSNSVSFGNGGKVSVEGAVADISISAGYALEWSESFEQSISYTIEESWQAQTDDSVILYRTPWFFFNYDIYDSKMGKWEENSLTVATENEPFYSQLSIKEYNRFVDYYNNEMSKRITAKLLTKIDAKASHVELHGNPYAYPGSAPQTFGSLQQMSYNGSATAISNNNESEMAHSTETAHGFTFDCELMFGISLFGDGVKAGIETSLETISGTSTGESTGTGITCGGMVQGVVEADMKKDGYTTEQIRAYSFNWKLGIWDSNVPTGKKNSSGKTLYVPVVGYLVSNVKSLPRPVSEIQAEVQYDTVGNPQGIQIKWGDPSAEFTGSPKPAEYNIYLIDGDAYEKIGSVKYGTNDFFFSDLQGRSSLRFEVRTVNGSNESIRGQQSACYIAYIGATGERGEKGEKGEKGDTGTGINDIRKTSSNGNIDTYTITLTDGSTYTFTVTNGKNTVTSVNDIEDGDYIIFTALDDGMSLDILGGAGAKSAGDNIHIWHNGAAKVFTLTKDITTGSYEIKSKVSGLVLDVAGGSRDNGANIQQWGSNGTNAQRWVFEPAENGYYYIRCIGGQYMDVAGMTDGNMPYDGVNVQSWEFTGAANQKFRLFKVPSNTNIFTASVLSEGSLAIVGSIATAAVGVITGIAVEKKKKSSATAGAEKEDEE